jgi:hypothetical protein
VYVVSFRLPRRGTAAAATCDAGRDRPSPDGALPWCFPPRWHRVAHAVRPRCPTSPPESTLRTKPRRPPSLEPLVKPRATPCPSLRTSSRRRRRRRRSPVSRRPPSNQRESFGPPVVRSPLRSARSSRAPSRSHPLLMPTVAMPMSLVLKLSRDAARAARSAASAASRCAAAMVRRQGSGGAAAPDPLLLRRSYNHHPLLRTSQSVPDPPRGNHCPVRFTSYFPARFLHPSYKTKRCAAQRIIQYLRHLFFFGYK